MRAAIIVVVLAAAGFVVWKFVPFGDDAAGGDETGIYTVRRTSFPINITEAGSLHAQRSTPIRAPTRGKIEWLEEEGKAVKEGAELVRLDRVDLENEISKLQDQLTSLESEKKTAETEQTIQEGQNKTDLEKAELALAVAKVERDKLLGKDIPAELRKLELDLKKRVQEFAEAQRQLAAKEELFKEEFVTQIELDQARLLVETSEAALETAKQAQETYNQYDIPLEKRKKTAAVDEAERGLVRAKKRAEAQLNAKKAKVRQKTIALGRTKRKLAMQQKLLSMMTLKAPTDGTVLYEQRRRGDGIQVGTQTWPGMVLMRLPDPSKLQAEIDVHEADVEKLKKGMEAVVTSEMKAGVTFPGKVIKIGLVPNAGNRWWGGDDIKRFKVLVELDGKDLPLKPGTSARVEIKVDEVEGALAVPAQAVQASEGTFFVYRLEDGEPVTVDVELGRSNDALVEIVKGLSEGDRVLLYSPDAAKTKKNGDEAKPAAAGKDE